MSDEEYNYFGVYTKNNENMKPSEIVANMSDDHTDSSGSLNAYDLIVGNSSRPLSRKETKEKLDNFILRGKVAPEPIRKSLEIEIKKKRWCCFWFK